MIRIVATALAVVLALTAIASSAPAKRAKSAAGKSASGDSAMSKHRAGAMRECNDKSGKLLQYTWGVTQLEVYQSCMAGHGEMN